MTNLNSIDTLVKDIDTQWSSIDTLMMAGKPGTTAERYFAYDMIAAEKGFGEIMQAMQNKRREDVEDFAPEDRRFVSSDAELSNIITYMRHFDWYANTKMLRVTR